MVYKRMTMDDRRQIARLYGQEVRVTEIANKVGCHPATVYEELKRGATGRLDKRQRPEYDPELAQRRAQEAIRRRGNRKDASAAGADPEK